MSPQDSTDALESTLSARVKNGTKTALVQYAHQKNVEAGPYEDVCPGTIQRRAVRELLRREWDDLPQEAKDALDDDLVANAGGDEETDGGVTVELEGATDEDVEHALNGDQEGQ